ncbi:proline-rich protein 18-like [Phyllopteryx taeniolatus]|uniref:proline-rich protein 18-like n=1 Tax=Phyllopteryx taeniolatus TaxID=161469 RepID=UPI002AD43D28|nr:proline-rich protein 18-like [Phyllopteryx taeniolatus]
MIRNTRASRQQTCHRWITPTGADYKFASISGGLSLAVISALRYKVKPRIAHRRGASDPSRMAHDARRYLASFLSRPFLGFRRKTELLAYLFLCVSKMPFIPPASPAGPGGKAEKAAAPPKEGASVEERPESDLGQLGKRSPPESRPPAAARRLPEPRKKGPSSRAPPESLPASVAKTHQIRQARSRGKAHPEETRFTLTLTPEAVVLLQRRNNNVIINSAVSGSVPDSRRPRRGHRPSPSPSPRLHGRAAAIGTRYDVSSTVKVSLLNERHRYDDVEYEDDEDRRGAGVDERVVLKCTEWLRGLENAPVTAGRGKAASVKSS